MVVAYIMKRYFALIFDMMMSSFYCFTYYQMFYNYAGVSQSLWVSKKAFIAVCFIDVVVLTSIANGFVYLVLSSAAAIIKTVGLFIYHCVSFTRSLRVHLGLTINLQLCNLPERYKLFLFIIYFISNLNVNLCMQILFCIFCQFSVNWWLCSVTL